MPITHRIIESSDLGFSLGTENHLIILPSRLLSGSTLLSSGSRLSQSLLLSFGDEKRAIIVSEMLKKVLSADMYRIRTYVDRSERNLDTVETLTDYISLILLVATVFAFFILRSAHESFFESLSRTLRVTEILGLTRRRQRVLLLMLYALIFPLATLTSLGFGYLIIGAIRQIPEAMSFSFILSALPSSLLVLTSIIVMAWFPAWWNIGRDETRKEKNTLSKYIYDSISARI